MAQACYPVKRLFSWSLHPSGGNGWKSHATFPRSMRRRRCGRLREPETCRISALVRFFLPSTHPLEMRMGRNGKKARISFRQLGKAESVLRNGSDPSWRPLAIQTSSCWAAVVTLAVAYHVRNASFHGQAVSSTGNGFPMAVRSCACSSVRSSFARRKRCCLPSRSDLRSFLCAQLDTTLRNAFITC